MIINYKNKKSQKRSECGVTLIEMTVVILVLLTLIAVSVSTITGYRNWEERTAATQVLRNVYNAQRTFLSENPTVNVADLVDADIIPYLSETASDGNGNILTLPTATFGKQDLIIDITVSPPAFDSDPSGDPDDGLWDLGG